MSKADTVVIKLPKGEIKLHEAEVKVENKTVTVTSSNVEVNIPSDKVSDSQVFTEGNVIKKVNIVVEGETETKITVK